MGTDRSKEFTLDQQTQHLGKPNRRCPHCGKVYPYNGNKTNCPNPDCRRRFPRYTITNSEGSMIGVN